MNEKQRDENKTVAGGAMLRLRPLAEDDAVGVNNLLCRSFGVDEMQSAIPPNVAPLSFVLENPDGEIKTACLGRVAKFGIFTVIADPESFDAEIAAENLSAFLCIAEAELTTQGACGIIVMVPPSFAGLAECLQRSGFASEKATALYWKYLPEFTAGAGRAGVTTKPS
ncbi:MAG TPA: hypothetical protein VIW23_13885 [Candidatus Acidoferrum sp.]|jgi:hypothetical protein